MRIVLADFNGAGEYFADEGSPEWDDLRGIVEGMPVFLQASDQAGIQGRPIFDPKATNAYLNEHARELGWRVVPVPEGLTEFGTDWDAGKRATLAEWQFSNYPFLWNNIIRSEAVLESGIRLLDLPPTRALIVVTKCAVFPASNSTLYFEQGRAQLGVATRFGAFSMPIRLVGLTVSDGCQEIDVIWSSYEGRYARHPIEVHKQRASVEWLRPGKYDAPRARFDLL